LPVLEQLDLFLDALEPRPAQVEQLGAALVAVQHLIKWHLTVLHPLHQSLEFREGILVARRVGLVLGAAVHVDAGTPSWNCSQAAPAQR
jgi:hypothetical protein